MLEKLPLQRFFIWPLGQAGSCGYVGVRYFLEEVREIGEYID